MGLGDLFRKKAPEEGDDLDGCSLDFGDEDAGPVDLDPDPDEDEEGGQGG